MGHNLEKNLAKIQGMKARGQHDRALKQLQDWARKFPDAPHYLYEAAMVAFDLEDYGVGLTALKNLVRSQPNTREKVLKACSTWYEDRPALPLAEFLIDNLVGLGRVTEALDVAARLDPDQLKVYARKTSLKHRSLRATSETPPAVLSQSSLTQLAVAHAIEDPALFAESAMELLDAEGDHQSVVVELLQEELKQHRDSLELRKAQGFALCAVGRVGEGSPILAQVCQQRREYAPEVSARLAALEPGAPARGRWMRALGDLAWVQGDGAAAARHYKDAADADPSLRADLTQFLENLTPPEDPAARAGLLKLHLRLLVVQGRFKAVPPLVETIRAEQLATDEELRALLGEGQTARDSKPADMIQILAEAALAANDLRAAATHIAEIPDRETGALHKILGAMQRIRPEGAADDLDWSALAAVLHARVGDAAGACQMLRDLWNHTPHETDTLFAITRTCLDRVSPTPDLVSAFVPAALEAGRTADAREVVEGALRFCDGHVQPLVQELVSALRARRDLAREMMALLDSCARELGTLHLLRYPTALAALYADFVERAVPEFSVLLMTRPELTDEVLEHFRGALERQPDHPALNLATYDILAEQGEIDQASQCLARALRAAPSDIAEISPRFDALLQKDPTDARLWRSYADALYHIGRFDQLADLCARASGHVDAKDLGSFRLLQARVLVEEGKLSDALALLEREIRGGSSDAGRALEILRDVVAANPTSSRAHVLLGDAACAQGNLEEAIASYLSAIRMHPDLLGRMEEKFRELASLPSVEGRHLLAIAGFYRRAQDAERAADMYDRAMQLQESLAERILGELAPRLDDPQVELPLLLVAARAARRAGHLQRACELLMRVDARDPHRFESLLTEFRKLGEAVPTDLLPIRFAARVLMSHNAPAAATQIIVDVSRNERYALKDRIDALAEFLSAQPGEARLALGLARLLGQQGDWTQAARLLRRAVEDSHCDLEEAVRVSHQLHEGSPHDADLGLLHHDILVRLGRIDEGLRALPEPIALPRERQGELSSRYAAQSRRALGDPRLALAYSQSLHRQGQIDASISVLRSAAESIDTDSAQPLWMELMRLLHETGRMADYRAAMRDAARNVQDKGDFYRNFGAWCEERLQRETASLRERVAREPGSPELSLSLAEKLLEQGKPGEVEHVLSLDFEDINDRVRRATLLARAYLDRGRAQMADLVLRAVVGLAHPESPQAQEIELYLAESAGRLGRWGESFARYENLLDRPSVGSRARVCANRAYAQYLSDAAGEYRGVLSKVSTLEPPEEGPEETS